MKSIDWKDPNVPLIAFVPEGNPSKLRAYPVPGHIEIEQSLSESMDRLHHEKHAKFLRWHDAITMNMIFGDNYVTVPEIPKGYEAYAKWWYDNELKAFK